MTMELRGKTVLVTGGAIRVGAAICDALVDHGCNVVIHYRSSAREADRLAERLMQRGVRAHTIQANLATERDCFELMDRSFSRAGCIDGLVNNAAVFHRGAIETCDADALTAEFATNLVVPVLLTREYAARAKTGRVVNLLDQRIAVPSGECLAYQLSKQALAEFTRSAAVALAPGIAVNGVAPGPVLPPEPGDEHTAHEPAGRFLLSHRPTPRDVAEAVVFLLAADGITGQIIFVDSGQHLAGGSRR